MKNTFRLVPVVVLIITLSSCTQRKVVTGSSGNHSDIPIAFPGAEGFGKYTTGGRGGKIYIVSNLNDAGKGSLRDAVNAKEPRIIVFAVSGTIHINTPLEIKGNVTIAGQTAPGDGICVADHMVKLEGDNIIIRYMRFRMGDKNQKGGMVNGNGGDDAFGGTRRKNIMIDHCSMSWSTDEVCSVYAGDSTTLQWNIISEPLNYSYHFETGDTDYEHHGFGGILGGRHISIHHNLYAHCSNRTPRFDGNRNIGNEIEHADYRNNVIYNWGSNNVYAGEGGNYIVMNNYYKYGPNTNKNARDKVANPYKKPPSLPFGKWYINGNHIDGSPAVTANNWLGVVMQDGTAKDAEAAKLSQPFSTEAVVTETAINAYTSVLNNGGASFRRDTMDERIVNDVRNRTGKIIDVQGGFPHGTDYQLTVNAWPALKSTPPLKDTDGDGMPDEFETKNGLNVNANEANSRTLNTLYDNIEVYMNGLVNTSGKK